MSRADARLIYVGDPMCSWCWGFAPEIERLSAHLLEHHPTTPLDVVVGGLRPGPNAQPLDARLSGFLRAEWTKINQATGQPFSFDTLDRKGWLYDTEVPAAAVALARAVGLAPVLEFMAAIQRAFYADAVDVTRPEVYASLWTYAPQTSVSSEEFVERLSQPASRQLAYADFERARDLGVRGFPAVIYERRTPPLDRRMVAYGYQSSDHLIPVVERLLADHEGAPGNPS